jgi:hypothetical protein
VRLPEATYDPSLCASNTGYQVPTASHRKGCLLDIEDYVDYCKHHIPGVIIMAIGVEGTRYSSELLSHEGVYHLSRETLTVIADGKTENTRLATDWEDLVKNLEVLTVSELFICYCVALSSFI